MIEIFQPEIDDGLEPYIKNNSLAFCTRLESTKQDQSEIVDKVVASEIQRITGSEHINLYPVKSILVTSSINRNDDIFLSKEMWMARHTPKDQPCNIEHSQKEIIGHIVGSFMVDDNFNVIPDDVDFDNLPEKTHIIANSVIYQQWEDLSYQEKIDNLISEIELGEWYVSMECLHQSFDYLIQKVDGSSIYVPRNHVTAFLTKYLRYYGGEGLYQGDRIYRVLRNFVFSGKGFVKRPANPESVIFNDVNVKKSVYSTNKSVNSVLPEIIQMSDTVDTKVKDLETQLAEVTKQRDEAQRQLASASVAKATELETKLTKAGEELVTVKAEVASKDKVIKDLETKLATATKTLEDLTVAKVKSDRMSKLVSAGFTEEVAEGFVDRMVDANDDIFDAFVIFAQSKEIGAPGNQSNELKVSGMKSVREYVQEQIASGKPKSGKPQETVKQAKATDVLEDNADDVDDKTGSVEQVDELEELRKSIASQLPNGFRNRKSN